MMTGMTLTDFMDKIYYGDELEFKIGEITYFIQGNKTDDVFTLTVDYWKTTDGTEANHEYLFDIRCSTAQERMTEFETAKIFDGKTIYEAEKDIEVLYG